MPISDKMLAWPHTWAPTLIERLCRQRVLSAACLAPPIGTYLLPTSQTQEGGLHYSLQDCRFLLFQMTQANIRWHSPVIEFPMRSVIFCGYHFKLQCPFLLRFDYKKQQKVQGMSLNMIWRRSLVFEGEPALPGADRDISRA